MGEVPKYDKYDLVFDPLADRAGRKRSRKRKLSAIGARIRILLLRMEWTQKDLAQRLGCSPQNLSGVFRSKHPRESTLKPIAAALGVSVDDLDPIGMRLKHD